MNNISQKIQVTPHHKSLASTISKFLAKQNKHIASNESTMEADEAVICDFGAQYKVLLTETSAGSAVELRVSIPSWNNLKEVSMKHLQGIFGESALIASKGAHQQHDFSIKVEQAMKAFDTSDECIQALSQVRILALGAPISLALQRIVDTSKRNDEKSSTTVQRLRMFPKCGQCYCLGSADKWVFPIIPSVSDRLTCFFFGSTVFIFTHNIYLPFSCLYFTFFAACTSGSC